MKKGEAGIMALMPEIILVAVVIWFGVAMPKPLITGLKSATAIVLQEEGNVFNEAPIFQGLFADTESSGRTAGK
jgi:hydrogenase-4 component F